MKNINKRLFYPPDHLWDRWMHKIRLPLFLLIGLIGASGVLHAEGEGDDPTKVNFFLSASQLTSDYYITTSWSGGLPSGNCECSNSAQFIDAYVGGYYTGTRLFHHNYTSSRNSGSFTYEVGPSYDENWYYNFWYDGREIASGCLTCSGGICERSCNNSERVLDGSGNPVFERARTAAIYNPSNLNASDTEGEGSLLNRIILTWDKGTDIPANQVGYKIYRNGSLIKTIAVGDVSYTFTDSLLTADTDYSYRVSTYTNDWGYHESTGSSSTGRTLSLGLSASQGTYTNKVKVTWNSISTSADNIRILRVVPLPLRNAQTAQKGHIEELAILNKHAESYTDTDVIPGFSYTYHINPIGPDGSTIQSFNTVGWMRPNGTIKGKVVSRGGAGVQNVLITVNYASSLAALKAPASSNYNAPFTAITDVDGYYEIRNIYYFDSARFSITPSYSGHGFTPTQSFRILDINSRTQSNVDFTDTTAITVGGFVHFQDPSNFGASGTDCGVEGAAITIDGVDYGIRSDNTGHWSYALTDSGNYDFDVYFKHHQFAVRSVNLNIGRDKTDIDFLDMQVDSIRVRVQDGCQNPLLTVSTQGAGSIEPKIRVVHQKGQACFNGLYSVDASGYATIVLPASSFNLTVDNTMGQQHLIFQGVQRAQLDTISYSFDLTVRDSSKRITRDTVWTRNPPQTLPNGVVIPGDTTFVAREDTLTRSLDWRADFVYFGPFDVTVYWEDGGADVYLDCNTDGASMGDSVIVVESGVRYPLSIEIRDQAAGCLVDTGSIKIWDFISDRENTPVVLPIQNGHAFYQMEAGLPNVAGGGNFPYQKYFYTQTSAGARSNVPHDWWGLVTGARQLTPTFTSRSPELPSLVVHDPPGDASFAYIEKGSSYTYHENTSYEISGSGGVYVDLTFGAAVKTPFTSQKAGINLQVELDAGRENFDNTGYENTLTFTQTFSTSADPLFTGNDGDVYIGKATNQQFAIAKVLTYNQSASCEADVSDEPSMYTIGIATTFIYTEKHIKETLIPQIQYLEEILRIQAAATSSPAEAQELIAEADSFGFDSRNWERILAKVDTARTLDAVFVENISFSAGADYEKVAEVETVTGGSYEYTEFVDIATNIGAKFEAEAVGWAENNVGIAAKFRHSFTKDTGRDTARTFNVGYVLSDVTLGDFFSVDILDDVTFGVPAFRLFAGTSACPHEPGTQARDRAKIEVLPPVLDNIPNGGTGNYVAYLTNESESQEGREYGVRVIPESNPNGAIVKIGGQQINNSSANFSIDAFQTVSIAFTVEQGPLAYNYDSIAIEIFPPCEFELDNVTNGDVVWITANFQSECTHVSLNEPVQGWLVNATSNDQLLFDFAGYDLNNPYFQSLTIEYKPNGQGWLAGPTIPRDSIVDVIYTYLLDVSGYPDGAYTMRARANCGSGKGVTYSSAVSGLIARNSIGPFGKPTPSDGFLRLGQDISIAFDKSIDCASATAALNAGNITLMNTEDSTFYPLTVQCNGNQGRLILVPTIDLFAMPELEDVILVASVKGIKDNQNNSQDYPITWAFKVNASPVNWDPDTLNVALAVGYTHTISSRLKNTSVLSKAFTIEQYPVWLTPTILSGSVLSDGEYEVNFLVDPGLPVGVYFDTVVAMVNGWPENLIINYEALAVPPNWSVDPSNYTYSMSVVAVFSLDQTDTNLSRDDRDLVAAIVNGEIRGLAQLEYVERFNKYMAFLTVYSNIIANEEVHFSLWRASNGVEFRAGESLYFNDNQVYGRIGDPQVFHTDGVYQNIPLKKGWNWISINVDNPDMTVANLLSSLGSSLVGNDITIKRKDGQTAQFTQIATPIIFGNQWSGPLAQLDNKQGYMLHLSDAPDTLRVPGTPITNFSNIDVLNGWNWIGFQPQYVQAVGTALNSVNPRNKDLVKSQTAFSEYHRGWNTWYGPLQFMEPGKGYKLNLTSTQTYNDLLYSARLGKDDYEVDHTRFESSMTIVASMGFEDEMAVSRGQLDRERLLIGAFVDDTCRGYGYLEWVEFIDDYRATFSVHGNLDDVGRKMSFRVYDSYSGQEFLSPNSPETYISDYFLGEVKQPYVLFDRLALPEAGYYLEQNYPNPYDSKTTIRFILPEAGQVKLTVFDQFGKTVKVLIDEELTAGEHTAIFEAAKLPSGVYHYTIEAGEFRASRKMVKM